MASPASVVCGKPDIAAAHAQQQRLSRFSLFRSPKLLNPTKIVSTSRRSLHGHVSRSRSCHIVNSSTGDFPKLFHKDFVPPAQLLPSDPSAVDVKNHKATVYTVRLCTSPARRAGLTAPLAGVQLCLVGKDGRAVLHRVPATNDHMHSSQELAKICEVVDDSVGINCTLTNASAASAVSSAQQPHKQRFQEGSIDEVSFLAPDLGPLAGLMVAPEAGTWTLDEVNVVSSRSGHADRFVNKQPLGENARDSAVYLTPIPFGAIVYGSGDSAIILTAEQAAALKTAGLNEYEANKQRLLKVSAAFTAGGTCVAAVAAGTDAAIPFVVGGAAGMVYSWLLQNRVDNLKVTTPSAGIQEASTTPLAPQLNAAVVADMMKGNTYRGAFVAMAGLLALWSMQETTGYVGEVESIPALPAPQAWHMLAGAMGFLTYKLAFLTVEFTAKDRAPAQALQPLDNRK